MLFVEVKSLDSIINVCIMLFYPPAEWELSPVYPQIRFIRLFVHVARNVIDFWQSSFFTSSRSK